MSFVTETNDGAGVVTERVTHYRDGSNNPMYKRENPPGTVLEDRASTAPELKTLESFELGPDKRANGAKVTNGVALSIPNASATIVDFDTPVFNDEGLVWDAANPSKLVACHDARFFALAGVVWDTDATGDRTITILKNGVDILDRDRDSGPGEADKRQMAGSYVDMVKGDYVELRVNQTSGAALGIGAEKCALTLHRAM